MKYRASLMRRLILILLASAGVALIVFVVLLRTFENDTPPERLVWSVEKNNTIPSHFQLLFFWREVDGNTRAGLQYWRDATIAADNDDLSEAEFRHWVPTAEMRRSLAELNQQLAGSLSRDEPTRVDVVSLQEDIGETVLEVTLHFLDGSLDVFVYELQGDNVVPREWRGYTAQAIAFFRVQQVVIAIIVSVGGGVLSAMLAMLFIYCCGRKTGNS